MKTYERLCCNLFLFGWFPGVWVLIADVSELTVGSIFIGRRLPMKMEPTVSSETSEIRTQTPGNYPKGNKLHLEHGESLKTRTFTLFVSVINQLDAHNFCFTISFILCLYMFRAPCAHHQEVKTVLYRLWYHHTDRWPPVWTTTYRCDSTRGCIIQFWPHDDEHIVLETCRSIK